MIGAVNVCQCYPHIETSQFICTATLTHNGLTYSKVEIKEFIRVNDYYCFLYIKCSKR